MPSSGTNLRQKWSFKCRSLLSLVFAILETLCFKIILRSSQNSSAERLSSRIITHLKQILSSSRVFSILRTGHKIRLEKPFNILFSSLQRRWKSHTWLQLLKHTIDISVFTWFIFILHHKSFVKVICLKSWISCRLLSFLLFVHI